MIRVILPASEIPIGSKVSKRAGDKMYTIRDRINIYGDNCTLNKIVAEKDARFIVSYNGDAVAISGDVDLVWYADEDALMKYLQIGE